MSLPRLEELKRHFSKEWEENRPNLATLDSEIELLSTELMAAAESSASMEDANLGGSHDDSDVRDWIRYFLTEQNDPQLKRYWQKRVVDSASILLCRYDWNTVEQFLRLLPEKIGFYHLPDTITKRVEELKPSIDNILMLAKGIPELPPLAQYRFLRMYNITQEIGPIGDVPETMEAFLVKTFGASGETRKDTLETVRNQEIVKITSLQTGEEAAYNELRAKRPMTVSGDDNKLHELIEEGKEKCPFEDPLTFTPADTFGRISGEYCVTASNVAKYTGLHGLVIFKEHNPLKFSREEISDYIRTAQEWFTTAHEHYPDFIYPVIGWNCLWKAGASLIHGHMQPMLTKQPYPEVTKFKDAALAYKAEYGSDFFDDLYSTHHILGLAFSNNARIITSLTPVKEKEAMILSASMDEGFIEDTARVLECFRDKLGVRSFNMAIYMPPLKKQGGWEGFPYVARIIDRGNPMARTVDMGIVEVLLKQSVIASDPFVVIRYLKGYFNRA